MSEHVISTDPTWKPRPAHKQSLAREADVLGPVARSRPGQASPTRGRLQGACCPLSPGF